MYGMDISNHQKKINMQAGNYDFVIIKATEGVGYIDPSFRSFVLEARKRNKLIGCYHYARPDKRSTKQEIEKEADWFIEIIRKEGLLYNAIIAIDWEEEPTDRTDLLEAMIIRIESQIGITPFIYANNSIVTKHEKSWPFQHCPLWIAKWGNNEGSVLGQLPNNLVKPVNKNLKIWQYTSRGIYPLYNGNVDLDFTKMSRLDWGKYSGENMGKEILSAEMEWAIEKKLFTGYQDGTYRPEEPLTRNQAAILLKRFYDMLNK